MDLGLCTVEALTTDLEVGTNACAMKAAKLKIENGRTDVKSPYEQIGAVRDIDRLLYLTQRSRRAML